MANAEHLEILGNGTYYWNRWRQSINEKGRHDLPDLRGANLKGMDLAGADLRLADLSGAILSNATLTQADLSGADLHMAQLKRADLGKANLRNADIGHANLTEANLGRANLGKSWLYKATLTKAYLDQAKLVSANLSGADLRYATLNGASLSGANLSNTNLSGAKFSKANLNNAKLVSAILDDTYFGGVNLTRVNFGKWPFQSGDGQRQYSLFISHSRSDTELGYTLSDELAQRGVVYWSDHLDEKKGLSIISSGEALDQCDAMIALMTEHSFSSSYVREELNHALFNINYKNRLLPVLIGEFSDPRLPWVLEKLPYLQFKNLKDTKTIAKKIADVFLAVLSLQRGNF